MPMVLTIANPIGVILPMGSLGPITQRFIPTIPITGGFTPIITMWSTHIMNNTSSVTMTFYSCEPVLAKEIFNLPEFGTGSVTYLYRSVEAMQCVSYFERAIAICYHISPHMNDHTLPHDLGVHE